MKQFLFFCTFTFFLACSDYVERPGKLLDEDTMSEIIAEMTVQEELLRLNPKSNMENATRFVLKKHEISAADFTASYKYYATSRKLQGILTEAQNIIKNSHPKADTYIENELKKIKKQELPSN
ncbi:DUF4296 domain-containing protein [Marnyiella aurantia]|uniref:DUF4296 domain-containing protein n=1 Tax=Marnyiella aurantia TaxID=2758037 RepID=A0A7D7QE47_9FLAO|nr:DUF4296 domain-containing protein [Marnyiella aurantia]MBA5246961.1 DUF4296 domain-containing protein [Marnyiella aurantia]MBP0611954.1 DUF4296 domain-containing protein [Marnyiella aurantia]QMS97701.1 DUF4296 domain-containing protein [Marnyiella aurantia]